MNKILVLWATPRSTSTAFEWMMRQRGDMTCFHEPFGEWWYEGEGAPWPRLTADSPRRAGLTFETVWQRLRDAAAAGPVFSKDFPHYVERHWDDEFLSHFTHSFLIRDAAKVCTSVQRRLPDVHFKELAFPEQRQLFDRLCDRDGTPPPVVDSDDLLESPAGIVAAYCAAVGIPFLPDALTWEAGADTGSYSWYDGGSWHENLKNSTGLAPQPRGYVDINEAPERAQRLHDLMRPHYEHLHRFRLRAATPVEPSVVEPA
ncbi:MAG: sulfotransferase family protein [Pseudomonadota bacterium]